MREIGKLLDHPILREDAAGYLMKELLQMLRDGITIAAIRAMYPGINEGALSTLERMYRTELKIKRWR